MTDEQGERRQQILQAALREFATKGFKGATIKSIAQAAQLQSPALIYWYFPTKEGLLQAVLEERAQFLQMTADPTALLDVPPEQVLLRLAQSYIGVADNEQNRLMGMVLISEVVKQSDIALQITDAFMPRVLGFLRSYFDHQINVGRFRPHDTRASAKMFMGMLIPQLVGKFAVPALRRDDLDDATHIQTTIEIFLRGLEAEHRT